MVIHLNRQLLLMISKYGTTGDGKLSEIVCHHATLSNLLILID